MRKGLRDALPNPSETDSSRFPQPEAFSIDQATHPPITHYSLRIHRHAIHLLLVVFVLLAATYSILTPPFETPDEIWHFAFIQHVATGKGLPVAEPNSQALWRQQGVQAPGYYLAAATLTAWIDQSDFPAIYDRANPHRAIGQPDAPGNRNYLIHYPDEEGWPWRGSLLALHVARFFSVFLGAVTIYAVYRTLDLILGRESALLGAAFVAFIPQFVFISAAASNDNAINATAALVLWQLTAMVRRTADGGRRTTDRLTHYVPLGLFLGLALISKLSALALVGLAGLTVLWMAWRARSWRPIGAAILWIGGPVLLIAGWWYVRNWLLYGDPLAWAMWEANILLRVVPAGAATILGELGGLFRSFWGLFGWMNVAYPEWLYWGFGAISLMVGGGLVMRSVNPSLTLPARREGTVGASRSEHDISPPPVAFPRGEIEGGKETQNPSLTLPARREGTVDASRSEHDISPPPVSFPRGEIEGGKETQNPSLTLPARREGTVDASRSEHDISPPPVAFPRGEIEGGKETQNPSLTLPARREGTVGASRSEHDISPPPVSFPRGEIEGGKETQNPSLTLPARREGTVDASRSRPTHSPPPVAFPRGEIEGGLWQLASIGLLLLWMLLLSYSWLRFMQIAPAAQGRYFFPAASTLALLFALGIGGFGARWGQRMGWAIISALALLTLITPFAVIRPVYTPPPPMIQAAQPAAAHLGMDDPQVAILSASASPEQLHPGETAQIEITWQALAPLADDYSVFVHLVDEEGFIIAQHDTMPGGGRLPISRWQPGQVIADRYRVAIPATAYMPNHGRWTVGLYSHRTGERLRVIDGDGDSFAFGDLTLAAPESPFGLLLPNPIEVDWADGVSLVGYAFSQRRLSPGEELTVTLYWRARQPVSQEYTTFVHILDQGFTMHGGHDGAPPIPPSAWFGHEDEIIVDPHTFLVSADAPAGEYQLEIGLYPWPSFARLRMLDTTGAEGADRLLLGPLRVAP